MCDRGPGDRRGAIRLSEEERVAHGLATRRQRQYDVREYGEQPPDVRQWREPTPCDSFFSLDQHMAETVCRGGVRVCVCV